MLSRRTRVLTTIAAAVVLASSARPDDRPRPEASPVPRQPPAQAADVPMGEAVTQTQPKATDVKPTDTTHYELIPWNSGHGAAMEPVAMNLMSAARAVSQFEDAITDKQLLAKPGESYHYGRLLGRVARSTVLDVWIMLWLSNVQHEWAGHRGRVMEFDARLVSLHLPAFWGTGGGYQADLTGLNDYQFCAVRAAGPEADSVWAEEVTRRSLAQPQTYYSDLPYVWLKTDLPAYVLGSDTPRPDSVDWARKAKEGWDVASYLDRFQRHSDWSLQRLYDASRSGAVWSLADPRLLASTYAYFVGYIGQGRRDVAFPMLRLGNISVLPGTGFHLSPMGPEYYAYLHARRGQSLLTAYGRRAVGHRNGPGYGFGVDGRGIVRDTRLSLDAAVDFWQPPVDVTQLETSPPNGSGCARGGGRTSWRVAG
jgi:hypothetical protein